MGMNVRRLNPILKAHGPNTKRNRSDTGVPFAEHGITTSGKLLNVSGHAMNGSVFGKNNRQGGKTE
jgi:hypothetical protein